MTTRAWRYFRAGAEGDWEWMWTTSSVDPGPAASSVECLAPSEILSIPAFIAQHSPTSVVGHGEGTQWFAVRSDDGALAAVGAYELARELATCPPSPWPATCGAGASGVSSRHT